MKIIREMLSVYGLQTTAKAEVGSRKSEVEFKNGFTLAEVLVVMAIVAIVGTVLVLIFTNTLRGSNKSQILSVMKQNGQAVMDNIDRTIRGSDNVVCPVSGSSGNTIVVVKNGTYSRYRIARPVDIGLSAPSICITTGNNGCIILDNPTPLASEATTRLCDPDALMSSAQILTDTNPLTGVEIESGFFTVSKPAGYKAIVNVKFTLESGALVPQVVRSQIDAIINQTTIELR